MVHWNHRFQHADWSDVFYPVGLKSRGYLPYYRRVFNCFEIDTTFYGITKEITVLRWAADTPKNFMFCLKTPRMVTHEMGLVGADGLMAEFVDRAQLLGEKLGPVLIQLPPSFSSDRQSVLEDFLSRLQPGVRYAIEVRSQSWYTATGEYQAPALQDILTHFGIAWVSIDYPGLPLQIVPTNDFIYIRWIGQHGSYDRHDHERILELVRDKHNRQFFDKRGEVGTISRDFCFRNGLIMRAVRDTMIISPPLVITRDQIDELAEKAWRCLDLTLERCRADGRF